jgi:hypothetical protein
MDNPGGIEWQVGPMQSVAQDKPILCRARTARLYSKGQAMNDYQVTFANGEVVEVEAWMPEIAQVIAEEEADLNGRPLPVVSVELLSVQQT